MPVMVVVSTLFGASVAFVVLRVASKLMSRTFCTEDYLIIAAISLAVAPMTGILCSKLFFIMYFLFPTCPSVYSSAGNVLLT